MPLSSPIGNNCAAYLKTKYEIHNHIKAENIFQNVQETSVDIKIEPFDTNLAETECDYLDNTYMIQDIENIKKESAEPIYNAEEHNNCVGGIYIKNHRFKVKRENENYEDDPLELSELDYLILGTYFKPLSLSNSFNFFKV